MWSIENLNNFFILLGIPAGFFVIILLILLSLHIYPQFKLFVGDFLKYIGVASKWIRRKSVESELEGTINTFIKQYNSDLITPLLPQCGVEWVNAKNVQSYIASGKVLVKLSFGRDHDLNLYNAANTFVEMAILPEAKPFLSQKASRSLNLMLLKNLLLVSRRQALRIFNNRFKDEDIDIKERFNQYEETDQKGLFKRILLQEYHFWGESLGSASPQTEHSEEAEKFWEWFYDLAMRNSDELSDLSFRSRNINIGVILVASTDTYEKFGYTPYIRRAFTYASSDCKCIYLVSRGLNKGKIAKAVSEKLVATDCFELLTKVPDVTLYEAPNEDPIIVTCIALRPYFTTIIQKAWEKLNKAKTQGGLVAATTKHVTKEGITVDVFGLLAEIENKNLSSLEIGDARKYFRKYDDLSLSVVDCDETENRVVLSNRDTPTDPKGLLEQFDDCIDIAIDASIERIIVNSENLDSGLLVSFKDKSINGFVPRRFATFSRYQKLSEEYAIGSIVKVVPLKFDAGHNTFLCSISGLKDPWADIHKYHVGDKVSAVVRDISTSRLLCELTPGMEASIPRTEISWGNKDVEASAVLDTCITAVITQIFPDSRKILLSIKRLTQSPVNTFFINTKERLVKATVKEVTQRGAFLNLESDDIRGFMPINEMMWNYCDDLTQVLKVDDQLDVKLLFYDITFDNIKVSRKQVYSNNNFEEFRKAYKEGDIVLGRPIFRVSGRILVSVVADKDKRFEGYVHKAELSNLCYIDETVIDNVLSFNHDYHFFVKRIDEQYQLIELSRKKYLAHHIHMIKAKNVYAALAVKHLGNRVYMQGDEIEGFLLGHLEYVKPGSGSNYNVTATRIDREKGVIELDL